MNPISSNTLLIFHTIHTNNDNALHMVSLVCFPFFAILSGLIGLWISKDKPIYQRLFNGMLFPTVIIGANFALFYYALQGSAERELQTAQDLNKVLINTPATHFEVTSPMPHLVEIKTWTEKPSGQFLGTVELPTITNQQTYQFNKEQWTTIANAYKLKTL